MIREMFLFYHYQNICATGCFDQINNRGIKMAILTKKTEKWEKEYQVKMNWVVLTGGKVENVK